jgi:hypothetical protein
VPSIELQSLVPLFEPRSVEREEVLDGVLPRRPDGLRLRPRGVVAADADELQRWAAHFDAVGVAHTGIINTGDGPTLIFRDPDNMQLELYVQPVAGDMPDLSDSDSSEAHRLLNEAR